MISKLLYTALLISVVVSFDNYVYTEIQGHLSTNDTMARKAWVLIRDHNYTGTGDGLAYVVARSYNGTKNGVDFVRSEVNSALSSINGEEKFVGILSALLFWFVAATLINPFKIIR